MAFIGIYLGQLEISIIRNLYLCFPFFIKILFTGHCSMPWCFFIIFIPGHDIGIVIVLVTLLIRLILAPSMQKSLKGQKQMNDLQPKLNEVREKYKDNKEAQAKAIMELYKEHKD